MSEDKAIGESLPNKAMKSPKKKTRFNSDDVTVFSSQDIKDVKHPLDCVAEYNADGEAWKRYPHAKHLKKPEISLEEQRRRIELGLDQESN